MKRVLIGKPYQQTIKTPCRREKRMKLTVVAVIVLHLANCTVALHSKPHIIFILADDLGWNDVGFHGMADVPTPNIDTLAANSVILNNYYVCSSCTPSRSALLTGMYPSRMGAQNVLSPYTPWGLPLHLKLLPQHLAKIGYKSAMIGKWHLGFYKKELTPTKRGFDYHYGTWHGAVDFLTHTADDSISNSSILRGIPPWLSGQRMVVNGSDLRENMETVTDQRGQYMTDLYTKKALDILSNHSSEKPLFLYLAHHAIHRGSLTFGHRAPAKYLARFPNIHDKRRKHYAGSLSALDDSVGQIMKALYRRDMLKNSIVVFSSDNGADQELLSANGGSNWPLRGQKFTVWEGGVRGVAFVWKSLLEPRVWDGMMHITDWLPTLYSAAGGDVSELGDIDGSNMWLHILSSDNLPSPRNEILIHHDPLLNYGAIRVGDFKLHYGKNFANGPSENGWLGSPFPTPQRGKFHSVVARVLQKFFQSVGRKFRSEAPPILVSCGGTTPDDLRLLRNQSLFNIASDPCEYQDLSATHTKVVEELQTALKKHSEKAIPPPTMKGDYNSIPIFYNDVWVPWFDEEFRQIRRSFSHIV